MARPAKIEVSAASIRIQEDRDRDYEQLLQNIQDLRLAYRVFGHTYLALSYFDSDTGKGVFSKYSEIDETSDWFDTESFGPAEQNDVKRVSIPKKLKPNLAAFDFVLDAELHVIVFETYSDSKSLSPSWVEKYLRWTFDNEEVVEKFGRVEVDVVKSVGEIDRILNLPLLKELQITIRRPNTDGIPKNLAAEIERRLAEQNGEELVETLKSKDADGLKPNERTRRLAYVAAENGNVSAKAMENGTTAAHNTSQKPLREVDTYQADEITTANMFARLVSRITDKIRGLRANA